jgi:polyisoprenoid-binding protein YceI
METKMSNDVPSGSLAQQSALVSYYKPIGPAAVVAALQHAGEKKKTGPETNTPHPTCRIVMSAPGVGEIAASSFVTANEDIDNVKKSRPVGTRLFPMSRILLAIGFLALLAVLPAHADTLSSLHGRYAIDSSSRIAFSVAQVGGGGIDGAFSRFSGSFDLRPDDIARSSVNFSLQPDSVVTGQPRVESFLRSAAVFDATAYPVITFRSTAVRQQGSDGAVIQGVLTARGIAHRETFEATLVKRQGHTIAFHVVGDMMRSAYGMDVGTPIYSNIARFDMMLNGQRK